MNLLNFCIREFNQKAWRFVAIGCLGIAVCAFTVFELVDTLEQESLHQHYMILDTVARMKTDQLLTWRNERLADARMNSSGLIKLITNEWVKTRNKKELDTIATRMETFRENERYHNMLLVDTKGSVLISLQSETEAESKRLEPEERNLVHQIIASQQPTLGDFYYCYTCNQIHISVGAPVLNENNQPIAVLLLVADPETAVFPLLRTWPISQNSSLPNTSNALQNFPETPYLAEPISWSGLNTEPEGISVLFRKENDKIRFLSPSQSLSAQPLSYTLGFTHTENPAVRAVVRGESGMLQGKDPNGDNILADVRGISGTKWHMITEIKLEKLLNKARFQAYGLLLLFLLAIGMTASLARLAIVSRQKLLADALLAAEQEKNQTREEIRATLYGIGDGVIATDANGCITRMNPEAERLTGWKEDEALKQPLSAVFNACDQNTKLAITLPLDRVLQDGEVIGVSQPILLVAQNKQTWPVTDSWSPIKNGKGEITGAVLVFRDQTKKLAMEKARRESAKKYCDMVDSVNDLIWETGANHCFTFMSNRSMSILGYRPEEIIGQCWDDFLVSHCHLSQHDDFLQRINRHEAYTQLCQTLSAKDGRHIILESNATPIFDKTGRFIGYRGISRDITERKEAEEKQQKLQAQLLQAQKMDTVGRLAGGVAHDFNNMLTVISSYVEMTLNELSETDPLYKRVTEIQRAAQHSSELTKQLLAFARKQIISPQILDLNSVITGALKMLKRLIGENIQLIWNPSPELWNIQMDATQIGQLLANLAVNARDAINGPGNLTISTCNIVIIQEEKVEGLDLPPGNYVRMTVTDDGCGMDSNTLSKIFEPFFTTKEEGKGTGLGLATVYGIVKQNNGAIDVISEPGAGTTFHIFFPKALTGTEATTVANNSIVEHGKETILLVEDEAAILELGIYILEQRGYTVLATDSPGKALSCCTEYQGKIDLLVTDVIMPEMNGRELAQEVLSVRPEIKVLFVSGYTADIISHHGGLDSEVQFLEKPFSASRLGKKVREVLDQQ